MDVEVDGAQGDFESVFAAVYPRARTLAWRILGSATDAEDAAAEALARALADWKRVGRLPHREAWILRVTANVAVDAARRRRPMAHDVTPKDDPEDATVLRMSLVAALTALPRRQREAVVLHHMAGYTQPALADALGVSANTAKKHLQRGMAKLRSTLRPEEGGSLVFD